MHPGLLFDIVFLLYMSHICTGCDVGYPSSKGLERHELQCTLKIAQEIVPDNAFELYQKKKERKRQALELQRRKNTSDDLPLSTLPYVRYFSYPYFISLFCNIIL